MEKDIMNFDEAAKFLKTSKPTLYRWIHEGRVKCFKVGRGWRFYRSDLLTFIESSDQEKEVIKRLLRQAIEVYDERLKKRGISVNP